MAFRRRSISKMLKNLEGKIDFIVIMSPRWQKLCHIQSETADTRPSQSDQPGGNDDNADQYHHQIPSPNHRRRLAICKGA